MKSIRERTAYWINKNKLNIIDSDVEYKFHIQSIDAWFREDYKKAYRLSRLANKMNKSHTVLYIGA